MGTAATVILLGVGWVTSAEAAQAPVGLGTATSFAVLAGTTVTNTNTPTVISGNLGVSPGTAVTNFPPGQVFNGAQHNGDAVALQAQTDLTTAYNDAAGRLPHTVLVGGPPADLGGLVLLPGVYQATSSMSLTGTVTLNAQGDPNAVFIFQAGSTLTTASASTVSLINGAQACNVFWQVTSSATLGTNSTFVGSIMALTSVTVTTGVTVVGRALARNGAVTLDADTITAPACAAAPAPAPSATATATATRPTGTRSPRPTTRPTGTRSPVPSPGPTGPSGGGGGGILPSGPPGTGVGGALRSGNAVLMGFGSAALAGSAAAMGLAIRRRRGWPVRNGADHGPMDTDE